MSTARSAFTEAIEEHLALKKQNATLEVAMPLARFDVGDPLDRYPGGPNRVADGAVVIAEDLDEMPAEQQTMVDAQPVGAMVGPSPEQAMEAASALEPSFTDRPFEPLNGMAPMLSLVEDIEDDALSAEMPAVDPESADVLRFPGGVGPREDAPAPTITADELIAMPTHAFSLPNEGAAMSPEAPAQQTALATDDAPTGEQPVLVIDTDEPLVTAGFDEPREPSRASRRSKPRFFGLGRKKQSQPENADGWFTDGPRDFNWD